jgi:hypothetical protein
MQCDVCVCECVYVVHVHVCRMRVCVCDLTRVQEPRVTIKRDATIAEYDRDTPVAVGHLPGSVHV